MKHYELEISRFIDNELPPDEQKLLFAHLSDCEECRNTLSDFMEMKKGSREFYENVDVELNPAIKLPAGIESKKGRNVYKSLFYFSAAASIILGLLFLMKQSGISKLESNYSLLKVKYNELTAARRNVQKNNIINEIKAENISSNKKKDTSVRKALPSNNVVKQNRVKLNQDVVSNRLADKNLEEIKSSLQNNEQLVHNISTLNEHAVNIAVKNVLDSLRSPNFYSRDLFYRYTPYVRGGKILIDTSFVRDLFLRKGRDKFYYEQPSERKVQNLAFNKRVKSLSSGILKNDNFIPKRRSRQIPVVQVTKSDFLTPQIIGN